MTAEDLIAMGLSKEQAKKVLDSLQENFAAKTAVEEIEEENRRLKQSVSERDKQLETLKKSDGDHAQLKKQIEELQKQNADQKKSHDAELSRLRLDNAVNAALTAAGAKNAKAVKALIDLTKVKLAEDGKLSGWDEQLAPLLKSDSYLFESKQQEKQILRGFQPGNSNGKKPSAAVDLSKMSYEELTRYIEDNPDAAND